MPDEYDKPRLTVGFEDTGELVSTGFTSYSITSSFFQNTDSWQFEVANPDDPQALRRTWRPWRPVRLYIDGRLQIIGRIDGNRGNERNSNLNVFGRDYLADLMDGGIDPTFKVTDDMDLGEAILGALRPNGIREVFGTNLTRNLKTGATPYAGPPPRDFKAAKVSDFNPGENDGALEWANKVAARHRFTLQPAGTRDSVLVIAPNYDQSPIATLRRPGNVISGSGSRNYADIPTVTNAAGRGARGDGSKGGLSVTLPTFGPISYWKKFNDTDEIRSIITRDDGSPAARFELYDQDKGGDVDPSAVYKPAYYTDKDSKTVEQLEAGVARTISDRLMRTLEYSCTVMGASDPKSGAVYATDTVFDIRDTVEGIFEEMWCFETTHAFSRGATTTMKFIRLGSYVL